MALQDYPLTGGTQRQPEEQAESYERPLASPSLRVPAPPLHQPGPGDPDPHISMPAAVPGLGGAADPSLPYPVPVSPSTRDHSSPSLPASVAPISGIPSRAGQNNPSTDAVSETTQPNARQMPGPANAGGFSDIMQVDITDHGPTGSTRMGIPEESAQRPLLTVDGRFLDPEKYEPVKPIGSGGFAKVIYHLNYQYFMHSVVKETQACCLNNHQGSR